ncbi:hypothetical protein SNE40_019945 [Patella caerulea]
MLRTNYISGIWNNATASEPAFTKPEEFGWVLGDHRYSLKWFDGDQVPKSLDSILINDLGTERDVDSDDDNETDVQTRRIDEETDEDELDE